MKNNWKFSMAIVSSPRCHRRGINRWTRAHVVDALEATGHGGAHGDEHVRISPG